jgi:hypothetical protein
VQLHRRGSPRALARGKNNTREVLSDHFFVLHTRNGPSHVTTMFPMFVPSLSRQNDRFHIQMPFVQAEPLVTTLLDHLIDKHGHHDEDNIIMRDRDKRMTVSVATATVTAHQPRQRLSPSLMVTLACERRHHADVVLMRCVRG